MRFWWSAIVILGASLSLRLYGISDRAIWFDEASSWQTANMSASEMYDSLRHSTHVPLYYPLLRMWMSLFGDSPATLRSLSVILGMLSAVGCGLLGWFLQCRRNSLAEEQCASEAVSDSSEAKWFGLFCASSFALSAFQVHSSVEARMYSLGTFFVMCSTWLMLSILRDNSARRYHWNALVCVTAASLYTHHFLALTAIVQAMILGWSVRHDSLGLSRWIRAILTTLILWLPGLWLWWEQFGRVRRGFWIPELSLWSLPRTAFEIIASPPPGLWWDYRFAGVPALLVILLLVIIAWWYGDRFTRSLVLQSAFPFVVIGVVSLFVPLWEGRYFRFAHGTLIICMAAGLWHIVSVDRWRGLVCVLAVGAMLAGTLFFWSVREIPGRQAVRGATFFIEQMDPGQNLPVIVKRPMDFVVARYYCSQLGWSNDRVKIWTGLDQDSAEASHLVSDSDWWKSRTQRVAAWWIEPSTKAEPLSSGTVIESPPYPSDLWIDDWTVHVRRGYAP